jgi:hypothetical protein
MSWFKNPFNFGPDQVVQQQTGKDVHSDAGQTVKTVGPVVAGVAAGVATGNPAIGFAVYGGMKYALNDLMPDGTPKPGAVPMGPANAPQMNPQAFQAPTQQYLGQDYYSTPEYQNHLSAFQGLQSQEQAVNNQIADIQTRAVAAANSGDTQQAIALRNQLQGLMGQRQTIHDQADAMNSQMNDLQARYEQNRDVSGLAGQASAAGGMAAQDRSLIGNSRDAQSQILGNMTNGQSGLGQQALVDRLNSDLNGGQPSLANLQLQAGAQQSLQNQAALAASGGPMNAAFAERNAALAGASTMQNLSMQQAQLRAQEYAQARGELGSVLANQRGQTIAEQQGAGQLAGAMRQGDTGLYGTDIGQQQWYTNAYLAEQARRQQQAQAYQTGSANNQLQYDIARMGQAQQAAQLAQQAYQYNQNRTDQQNNSYLNMVGTGLAAMGTQKGGGGPAPASDADNMYAPGKTPGYNDWGY